MKSHARMLLKPQQQHGMNKQGMQLNGDFSFESYTHIYVYMKKSKCFLRWMTTASAEHRNVWSSKRNKKIQ